APFRNLSASAQAAIIKSLSFDAADRHPSARKFGEDLASALTTGQGTTLISPDATTKFNRPGFSPPEAPLRQTVPTALETGATAMRIALLYKRNAQPDEEVLHLLESRLTDYGYQIFIDRHLTIGMEWAKEIERQVRTSDIVIPLLSVASV